ncbi:unnamed protein product, partial [Mesorhabditis belari]|uniref:Uncharacterized protein n=1 Tax=Mesorhabditis belari TaxID=2138241 RepID=A0AAF3EWJ2_9BILA
MEEINGTSSRRQSDEEKPPMQKRKTTSLDKPGKNDEILTGGSPLKVACKKPEVSIAGVGTIDFVKLDGNKVIEKDKEADETQEMEFSHSPSLNSTALLSDTTATHYSTAEESPPLERKNLRVKFYEHVQEKEISDYSSMSSNSSADAQSLFESFSGEEIRVTSSDSNSEMNISSDNSDGSILFLGEMNSNSLRRFKNLPCDEDMNPNVAAIESTENDASLPGPSTSQQEKRKVTFNPEVYEIVFFPEEWLHEIPGLCGPIKEEDDEEEQAPQPEIAAPTPTLAPVKEKTTYPEEAATLAVHQSTSNSTTIQNVEPDHLEYEAMKKQLEDQRQAHEIYRDAREARLRVEEIARKNAEEQSTNLQKLMQGEIRARLVVEEENSQLLKQLLDAKTDLMRASAQVQDNRNAFQQHLIERIVEKEETSQSFSALLNSTKNLTLPHESMDADSDCQRMSDIDSTFELNEAAENN